MDITTSPSQRDGFDTLDLVYVFDAYCGWSYGFAPTLIELSNRFPDATLDVVSGGLFVGERRAPLSQLGFIEAANRKISDLSGVEFGPGFADLAAAGSFVMDSESVARSVAALRALQHVDLPTALFELQRAFYVDGLDISDPDVVIGLASRLGVDCDALADALAAESRSPDRALLDFARSSELGVTTYPTLLASVGGPSSVVATGLVPLERIEHALSELAPA